MISGQKQLEVSFQCFYLVPFYYLSLIRALTSSWSQMWPSSCFHLLCLSWTREGVFPGSVWPRVHRRPSPPCDIHFPPVTSSQMTQSESEPVHLHSKHQHVASMFEEKLQNVTGLFSATRENTLRASLSHMFNTCCLFPLKNTSFASKKTLFLFDVH